MARLGLGYEAVRAINLRLIYCSISGYGQSGPRSDEAGHDINYIGNAGLLDLQPGPVEAPVVPPMLAADVAGGSFPAVINILLALRARDQSGQGCHLDSAMSDAMFTFAWYALALGLASGKFPKPGELALVGGSPRYRIYATKDGKLVACGAIEQKFWLAFCKVIGLGAEFIDDMRAHARSGRQMHRVTHGGGVATHPRGRRLLRHHRDAAARSDARSAFPPQFRAKPGAKKAPPRG
jgi:alpha-methylacyl-CoA racemase